MCIYIYTHHRDADGDADADADADSTKLFIHSYYTRAALSRQPMERVVDETCQSCQTASFPLIAKPSRQLIDICI